MVRCILICQLSLIYRDLYYDTSSIGSNSLDIDSIVLSLVTDAENSSLMAIPSSEEIKTGVFLWIGIVLQVLIGFLELFIVTIGISLVQMWILLLDNFFYRVLDS